jgi:hypothetical protein
MTTTSYPLDGKAGTNIGKAMTDSSTHRLIEVRLAPISGEKADMLEGPSCARSGLMQCSKLQVYSPRSAAVQASNALDAIASIMDLGSNKAT